MFKEVEQLSQDQERVLPGPQEVSHFLLSILRTHVGLQIPLLYSRVAGRQCGSKSATECKHPSNHPSWGSAVPGLAWPATYGFPCSLLVSLLGSAAVADLTMS